MAPGMTLEGEHGPNRVHVSWSWRATGVKNEVAVGFLGLQTKRCLFKAFRASLRAHRGVLILKKRMEGRCHTTLGPAAGDAGLAPLTWVAAQPLARCNHSRMRQTATAHASTKNKKIPDCYLG